MKRLVSLILALMLAMGVVCAASAEEKQYDRVTITYTCPQVVAGYDYNAPNGDGYSNWILGKFNIDFQGTNVSWGDWMNNLVTWIYAQDMTDVAIYNFSENTATTATDIVNQGLLFRLPDDWKERWPGVADVYSKTSLGPMLEELYGGTYFIPRARFYYNLPGDPLANHWCLWMRSDWIKAVGKEVKHSYTIPEVLEICKLIKEQDPGQVGANLLPLEMDTGNSANFFLRANSTYWDTFYKDADGKYQWGAAAPETLEGLKLWFQAYKVDEVLDPEYYLLDHEKDLENFQTLGIAGVSYLGGQTADVENYRKTFKERTGHEYEDFHMANLLGADGYYHQRDLINFWGAVCFKPDVDPAVFERWMDLMEWTCSKEGYPATSMGLKGEDWDFDENGNIISLIDPQEVQLAGAVGEAKYPSLGHVLGSVILWDDLAMDNPNIREDLREESKLLYKLRTDESTPETFVKVDWKLYMDGSDELRTVNGIQYAEEFSNMITTATSEENLEEIYKAWIESKQSIVQPALDELNK